MIVVPDDVIQGVGSAWDGSTMPTLVTGGLHQRPPSGTVPPYGVIACEDGDQEDFSGKAYLKTFRVRVSVYAESVPSNSGTIRRTLENLLDRSATLTVPNADLLIAVKPAAGGLTLAEQKRNANDVVIAQATWDVIVQGSRP